MAGERSRARKPGQTSGDHGGTKKRVAPADLELDSPFEKYQGKRLREAREALEREIIEKALAKHGGNITHAATELGISRPTLHDLINKYSIVI